jgi:DNA-directed RNA polymerase subunit beta
MQRQAVPLLVTEAPLVATGLEERAARDSRAVIVAEEGGKVASVTGSQIIITEDGKMPEGKKKIKNDPEKGLYVYQVRKFMRSNAATCINQKILVKKGEHVKKGQVIADGPCTQGRRTCAGTERPGGIHAVERIQLRGRHLDLRADCQRRRLHVDSHRRV